MLKLTINTGNDAFAIDLPAETARILRDAADRIEASGAADGLVLRDICGNEVGRVAWEG